MSKNKSFPFCRAHKAGVSVVVQNRVVASQVPLNRRNFYLDTPSSVLRVVFSNSSPAQLAVHFSAIQQLLLNHSFNCNKRRSLFKLLRFIQTLGGV